MKHYYIALAVLLIFAREVARANPPEYLAASREPAENTSEEVSPIEEPSLELSGWRLAMHSTEPFFRDSIFSLEPRFYYRSVDDDEGRHEAFAGPRDGLRLTVVQEFVQE